MLNALTFNNIKLLTSVIDNPKNGGYLSRCYHFTITPLAIFHSINKSVKFVKYYLIGCPRSEIEGY